MKHLKKREWISILLCLFLIIPGIAVYQQLPERIATHWSLNNTPDQTQPKAMAVFLLPVLYAVLILLSSILMRRPEQKERAGKLPAVLQGLLPVMFYVIHGSILLYALGKLKDILLVGALIVSVLLIVFGNYMPKIRMNRTFGIRTPHIMSGEEIWHRTHRFAGYAMTAGGAAAFVTALLGMMIVTLIIVFVSVLAPAVYGETLYYRGKGRQKSS